MTEAEEKRKTAITEMVMRLVQEYDSPTGTVDEKLMHWRWNNEPKFRAFVLCFAYALFDSGCPNPEITTPAQMRVALLLTDRSLIPHGELLRDIQRRVK